MAPTDWDPNQWAEIRPKLQALMESPKGGMRVRPTVPSRRRLLCAVTVKNGWLRPWRSQPSSASLVQVPRSQ
jgi:hypothetical protein